MADQPPPMQQPYCRPAAGESSGSCWVLRLSQTRREIPRSFWPRLATHGAGFFLRERRACKAPADVTHAGASTVGRPALAALRTAVPGCKVKFESETVGLEATLPAVACIGVQTARSCQIASLRKTVPAQFRQTGPGDI